jgi:hypothetical protein
MRIALIAALAVAPSLAAAEVTLVDNNKTQTIDCAKDPEVSLIGNHLAITLTGTCKKLQITGSHETVTGSALVVFVAGNENTLAISAADEITVAGSKNTIAWKQGANAPKVTNSGKQNKITQAK